MPQLVATSWISAADTSPVRTPGTSPIPITERVAAIADAGFCGLGLIADDLSATRDDIGCGALRGLIADAGLTHVEIELLERWWIPRGQPGHTYVIRDLLFDAADALTPAMIKLGSQNGPPCSDPMALAAPLRELAAQAASHGTRVAIETMPFSAIATVPMGAGIVAAADHPAAGLLIDAWHVFRAGTSLAELRAALRAEFIFGVELDDAAADVVARCSRTPSGVEILSTSYRAPPVDRALGLAADSARTMLSSASAAER